MREKQLVLGIFKKSTVFPPLIGVISQLVAAMFRDREEKNKCSLCQIKYFQNRIFSKPPKIRDASLFSKLV